MPELEHKDDDRTQTHVALIKGTMVSHYRIVDKIGAGGMGEVYLAEDRQLNRKVALKFLPAYLCQDDDCRARFRREAQAAAKLDHPNIVTVHEVGEFQGRPFFAMAHVEGRSVRDLVGNSELSTVQMLELGIQVCEGLQAAHAQGITHRDIKPSNILIDSHGRARIVDFGLASVAGAGELTKTGSTLGTIGYMSPEQVRGEAIDHRSDLFSLGVVLYELLTGRNPFKRDSEAATLRAVTDAAPEPLARFKAGVSDSIQAVLRKALEKSVETRYQTAAGMVSDLKRCLKEGPEVPAVHSDQPSVAVLPFANLSADPEQEYFCDGMAEEIINALAQLENLRVIARTSSFAFRGKQEDVRQIGNRLGVGSLVEGSVRKVGNRLRVTAQLVRTDDGSHLWSERYDRDLEDVFAVQDEIASAIVGKLKVRLLPSEQGSLVKRYTEDFDTYRLYLLGRQHWNKRTPEGISKAIECFQQVIEANPTYALAYSGLADCYSLLEQAWVLPPNEAFPKAKAMALKALEIDDTLAEAHASMALVYNHYDWDRQSAEKEILRAIELRSNYATAYQWYAIVLSVSGRHDEACRAIQRALQLDPLSPIIGSAASTISFLARDFDTAEKQARAVLEDYPDFDFGNITLAWVLEQTGRLDEAVQNLLKEFSITQFSAESIEELDLAYKEEGWRGFWLKGVELLVERERHHYVPASSIASGYARLGDAEEIFKWLERALEQREPGMTFLHIDPCFDEIHGDPRYIDLINRIGM